MGVTGVRGDSSPASLDAHDMDPAEGDGEIHEFRFEDHELEGARPAVAVTGVCGTSGL